MVQNSTGCLPFRPVSKTFEEVEEDEIENDALDEISSLADRVEAKKGNGRNDFVI